MLEMLATETRRVGNHRKREEPPESTQQILSQGVRYNFLESLQETYSEVDKLEFAKRIEL